MCIYTYLCPGRNVIVQAAKTCFLIIFGRTDLRISLSGAKFDAEADFDIHLASPSQKSDQISKKLTVVTFRSENSARTKFLGVEK